MDPFRKPRWYKAYSFGLVTLVLFLVSWVLQLIFQWIEAQNEAKTHGEQLTWAEFLPQFFSATFENWQSEFLQAAWTVAGLGLFYYWGSSQSKEGDARIEAKLDRILRHIDED